MSGPDPVIPRVVAGGAGLEEDSVRGWEGEEVVEGSRRTPLTQREEEDREWGELVPVFFLIPESKSSEPKFTVVYFERL